MKFNDTQYYYQGYSSHQTGLPYESSPHPIGSLARLEWCRGWRDAENDSRKRVTATENDNANQKFESMAAKPAQAWSGEGLPPVGTECEWRAGGHNWIGVKVLAYHEDEVWLQPLNGEESFTLSDPDDFRLMRTRAERQRHETLYALEKLDIDSDITVRVLDAIAAGKIPHIKVELAYE